MTDPPRHPETRDDNGMQYERESTSGIPRWVKVVGIVVAVLALLVVVAILTGVGGGHGPSRHTQSGDTSGRTLPASANHGARTP